MKRYTVFVIIWLFFILFAGIGGAQRVDFTEFYADTYSAPPTKEIVLDLEGEQEKWSPYGISWLSTAVWYAYEYDPFDGYGIFPWSSSSPLKIIFNNPTNAITIQWLVMGGGVSPKSIGVIAYSLTGEILDAFGAFNSSDIVSDINDAIGSYWAQNSDDYINSQPFGNIIFGTDLLTTPNDQIKYLEVYGQSGWSFVSTLEWGSGFTPPSFPDDTSAPTGAVHAHNNLIWPPNNKMVTVTLDGYVKDEMSSVRDGTGIGVSSAYLLVDGAEKIILRDEITDLLDDDGYFALDIEVKATAGSEYFVELYATDTEPEEHGGPNSGLVDSTYIRVSQNMR